jgi:hypothetical protein
MSFHRNDKLCVLLHQHKLLYICRQFKIGLKIKCIIVWTKGEVQCIAKTRIVDVGAATLLGCIIYICRQFKTRLIIKCIIIWTKERSNVLWKRELSRKLLLYPTRLDQMMWSIKLATVWPATLHQSTLHSIKLPIGLTLPLHRLSNWLASTLATRPTVWDHTWPVVRRVRVSSLATTCRSDPVDAPPLATVAMDPGDRSTQPPAGTKRKRLGMIGRPAAGENEARGPQEKTRSAGTLRAWGKRGGGAEKNEMEIPMAKHHRAHICTSTRRDGKLLLMPSCFTNLLEAIFPCFARIGWWQVHVPNC